jgi:tetratricopeptide (TPR) repeat protein
MYNKSLNILKNAPATDIADPNMKTQQMATALRGLFDTFRLMALTEQVDETKLEVAKSAIPEYMAAETDAAKKDQAKLILGDLYRVTGDADNAIAEYRKALEGSPESLDAMAGLGLSLVNAGYINNNKEQLQEGANYLQKYASAAPDTHKYKADALGLIESLKSEQKIQPQKVSTPARRRNN